MSKAFDNFDTTPEPPARFWPPFLLGLLFAVPASALWFYLAVYQGLGAPVFSLAVGFMCGWGVRKADGDYGPAFTGTLIHIAATILIITLVLLADELGLSLGETVRLALFEGKFTDFLNMGISDMGRRSFISIPIAFYVAYKALGRD